MGNALPSTAPLAIEEAPLSTSGVEIVDQQAGLEESFISGGDGMRPSRIGFRLNSNGKPVPDHPSLKTGKALLLKSLGIKDPKMYGVVVQQLIGVSCRKHFDIDAVNEMLSLVQSLQPRDELETMLTLQMAAVHCKSMRFLSKLDRARTLEEHATYERTANKLFRTFGHLVEAMRKHRHGGSQNVYVKHVHVQDGGQAIVGNVSKDHYR